jgi:regulator of replication initiation timing
MAIKKKYVMPEIDDLAEAGPQVAELIEFVEELTDHANAVYEQAQALQAELTRLKKAKKRAARTSK